MEKNFHLETEELLRTIEEFKEVHQISHENLGSFISTVKDFFTARLKKVIAIFKINMNRTQSAEELTYYVKEIIRLQPDINRVTQKLDFLEVQDTIVPTIQGLKTNLLAITNDLAKASSLAVDNVPKEFALLDEITSKMISSEDYRRQLRPLPHVDGNLNKNLKEVLEKHIITNKVTDTDKLGNVIPNLSSLTTIASNLITTGNKQTVDKMNKLQEMVVSLDIKGNELLELLKDKEVEVSKNVLDSYSEHLAAAAESCTLAASIYHLNNRAAAVTKAIVEKLKNKL